MREAPLPTPSAAFGPAFRVGEARTLGHSDWRTRPSRMLTPTKGVRSLEMIAGLGARAGAFALAMPDDVAFSHTTAALIHGLPLPSTLQSERDLHVMRETSRPPIERAGCVSHRGLERRETVSVNGLRVTSLADTWLDLVEGFFRRIDLSDAVMMGDAAVEMLQPTRLLAERHPEAEPGTADWWLDPTTSGCQALRRRLSARHTFRGRRLASQALLLVRPRVWSPMESKSRLVVVQRALPEPELNAGVTWPDTGELIGYGDLVWGRRKAVRAKVVGEYQGRDVHTEEESSRARDTERCRLMRDAGWEVIELFSKDVLTERGRTALAQRLRALL